MNRYKTRLPNPNPELVSPAPAPPEDLAQDIPSRHSTRVRSILAHLLDYHCYTALATLHEPHTYREASTDPLWQIAIKEEFDALSKNHTWDLVILPPGKSVVGCKQIYKIKTRFDGSIERYKPPLGLFVDSNKVCHLRRALYGLKQALRAWFAKFSFTISRLGYMTSHYDSTLFLRRIDKGTILLLLYVDDMIITSDDLSGIHDLKDFLSQQFEMKDLGYLIFFLGLEITHSTDGFYITQVKYVFELLSRVGLTDSKIVDTQVELNAHLTPSGGKPLSNPSLYRRLVGSLVYLIVTHLDISYTIHQVSQ